MEIKKEYKFYAGHRNQELINTKCFRPHGHDYKVFITFNVKRKGNITTLFEEFDNVFEPFFKEVLDHRFLIDTNDPLIPYFKQYEKDHNTDLGLCVMDYPTSVENVCYFIFDFIVTKTKFNVSLLELQETRSSIINYTYEDYLDDKSILKK